MSPEGAYVPSVCSSERNTLASQPSICFGLVGAKALSGGASDTKVNASLAVLVSPPR